MKQLRVVMHRMREAPDDITVLFGGDTNLRDPEASRPSSPIVPVGEAGVERNVSSALVPGGQGGSAYRRV